MARCSRTITACSIALTLCVGCGRTGLHQAADDAGGSITEAGPHPDGAAKDGVHDGLLALDLLPLVPRDELTFFEQLNDFGLAPPHRARRIRSDGSGLSTLPGFEDLRLLPGTRLKGSTKVRDLRLPYSAASDPRLRGRGTLWRLEQETGGETWRGFWLAQPDGTLCELYRIPRRCTPTQCTDVSGDIAVSQDGALLFVARPPNAVAVLRPDACVLSGQRVHEIEMPASDFLLPRSLALSSRAAYYVTRNAAQNTLWRQLLAWPQSPPTALPTPVLSNGSSATWISGQEGVGAGGSDLVIFTAAHPPFGHVFASSDEDVFAARDGQAGKALSTNPGAYGAIPDQLVLSPSGKSVAFVRFASSDGWPDVFVAPSDGSAVSLDLQTRSVFPGPELAIETIAFVDDNHVMLKVSMPIVGGRARHAYLYDRQQASFRALSHMGQAPFGSASVSAATVTDLWIGPHGHLLLRVYDHKPPQGLWRILAIDLQSGARLTLWEQGRVRSPHAPLIRCGMQNELAVFTASDGAGDDIVVAVDVRNPTSVHPLGDGPGATKGRGIDQLACTDDGQQLVYGGSTAVAALATTAFPQPAPTRRVGQSTNPAMGDMGLHAVTTTHALYVSAGRSIWRLPIASGAGKLVYQAPYPVQLLGARALP